MTLFLTPYHQYHPKNQSRSSETMVYSNHSRKMKKADKKAMAETTVGRETFLQTSLEG